MARDRCHGRARPRIEVVFFAAMGSRLLLDAAGIAALVRSGIAAK